MSVRDHESDAGSIHDDSPIDGYFERRDMPREVYEEYPEVAKAREARAREESRSRGRNRSQSPQSSRVSLSPSARSWMSESEAPIRDAGPFPHAGPPPPAYHEALGNRSEAQVLADTANMQQPQNSDEHTSLIADRADDGAIPSNYGTHPRTSRSPFDPSRPPQSMGGSDPEDRRNMEQRNRRRKRGHWHCGRIISKVLLTGLVICAILIVTSLASTKREHAGNDSDSKPSPPANGTLPVSPGYPSPPRGKPNDHRAAICAFEHFSDAHYYAFQSPDSFALYEFIESYQTSPDIQGRVRVLPARSDQEPNILVVMSYATSAQYIINGIHAEEESDSLYLRKLVDSAQAGTTSRRSCLDIYIDIYVKQDIELATFEIATDHLDLTIQSELFDGKDQDSVIKAPRGSQGLFISNTTELNAVRGNVDIAYWSSRETRVETISGSITGHFALRDLLSIKTQSGSVTVSVDPKPSDKAAPAPAEFIAASTSGSLNVHFPLDSDIPEREYRSRVESQSGSVRGSYLLGLLASFKTTAGSITATILPYAADMFASTLRTDTSVGRTEIEVLSPYKNPGRIIDRLHSMHTSISASLELKYPDEWEGVVEAATVSSSINLKGKDLHKLEQQEAPWAKHQVAKKGHGSSKMDLKSTSGSIDAMIGFGW